MSVIKISWTEEYDEARIEKKIEHTMVRENSREYRLKIVWISFRLNDYNALIL